MSRHDEQRLTRAGLLNGGIGYALIASGWFPAVAAGWLVRGFAMPWVVVAVVTAGQRLTPDELQGRVAATITFLLFATQPPAQAIGAALIGVLDYRVVYALSARPAWV
jgi:L-cystine uptake protein TcyP (sodium:dicarboxylate symporter family)